MYPLFKWRKKCQKKSITLLYYCLLKLPSFRVKQAQLNPLTPALTDFADVIKKKRKNKIEHGKQCRACAFQNFFGRVLEMGSSSELTLERAPVRGGAQQEGPPPAGRDPEYFSTVSVK